MHRSNDAPHGLFVVGSAAVVASVQGSSVTRQLGFTVSRQFGNQGTVEITTSMYYDQVCSTTAILFFIRYIVV